MECREHTGLGTSKTPALFSPTTLGVRYSLLIKVFRAEPQICAC